MNFNHNNPVLEAFDLLEKLEEAPSGQFSAIHAGSKFVPSEVKNRLHKEAYANFNENLKKFKAELESISGKESEVVDEHTTRTWFNDEKSIIGTATAGNCFCKVCYDEEEELRGRDWAYECSHYGAGVLIRLTIDGVSYHSYRGPENKYYRGLYDVMSDLPDAKLAVDKACREAEAKLLEIAKKYFPDAEVKQTRIFMNTDFGTMIELDFSKAYQAAGNQYHQMIADYEVSDEEIEAEENRISQAIMDYYASKKPGEYVGD